MAKGKAVAPVRPAGKPANNVAGTPGKVVAQSPIPGPAAPGQPASLKKALSRKPVRSKGL